MADWKNNNDEEKYVGAPYNFVPFYNDVVGVEETSMGVHDVISDRLLTGEISYRLKAETPVFIGDGHKDIDGRSNEHFFRNEKGEMAIPGSSIRGLIRSNAQILGLSGFDQDIDDYHLMFREVAGGVDRKRYGDILGNKPLPVSGGKQISILKNVRAGYLVKEGSEYRIYKTEVDTIKETLGEMNYYVLSERKISEDTNYKDFPYFREHPERAQNVLEKGFRKEVRKGRVHYKGVPNKKYKPGYTPVSYSFKDLKNVTRVGAPGVFENDGVLMGTGFMNEKKVQYIIPKIDRNKEYIEISEKDIKAFEIDFNKRVNALKSFGDPQFFNLPKEGEEKPVFYIERPQNEHGTFGESNSRLYFGFTPRLRLFYDYTIKDGYHQKVQKFDYAMSLFGMARKECSYKSKTSFSDAVVCSNSIEMKEQKVILAEPKPTSYMDYLQQDDQKNTYNSEEFELRGVKQYWLRKEPISGVNTAQSEKVYSSLRPLDKGVCFAGKVRFENLTEAELGLLLWSIRLNKNSWMNIGKAKAYGYGAISVKELTVFCRNNAKAYDLGGTLDFFPFETMDVDELIQVYKDEINANIPNHNIDILPQIKTFFAMKNAEDMPENDKIAYMSIDKDKKEYQDRKKALPKVEDILEKEKGAKLTPTAEGTHMAVVIGYEGKKIKFKTKESMKYPKITIDDIVPQMPELTKKNMKEKFPLNRECKLRFKEGKWSILL